MLIGALPLISAGVSLVGGILGGRRSGAEKAADRAMRYATSDQERRTSGYDTDARRMGRTAEGSRNTYLDALMGFDPGEYASTTAGALFDEFGETAERAEAGREVALNRRGFLGSGVGTGQMNRELATRLARELAGLSMQTAGLEQGRISGLGSVAGLDQGRYQYDRAVAEDSRNTYLDMLAGNRDRAVDRGNARRKAIGGAFDSVVGYLPGIVNG